MEPRIAYAKAAPGASRAMYALETYVRQCGLEPSLLELVKTRASQINGCAYCLDMHWKDARAAGETEHRLYGLDAWREYSIYTQRERAALELCEAMTLIADFHVPDGVWNLAAGAFPEEELAQLVFAIATRARPGPYRPPAPVP